MSDLDGLIRASLKAPDDQAPRLVMADWLDERNDPRGPALRVSHDLSFGELPEAKPVVSNWGRHPSNRLACRLALIAYERRTRQWKIDEMYLTTCELYACRLIGPKRRDAWLRGPYRKMFDEWPFLRYPAAALERFSTLYFRNAAAVLMRACGDCQLPFDQLDRLDWPLARSILSAARDWIYKRMFEAVKDDRGTWYGYRRFVSYPNGRRVHGAKARAFLDHNAG